VLPLNDGLPSSPDSTEWKHFVRKFWNMPLDEREKGTLLTEGELTLVSDVSREQFLASFDHEDDDFARGMEWRASGDASSEVGDIVLVRLPNEPHEVAAGALLRAVSSFIDINTPSPSISRTIVSTQHNAMYWWSSLL